MIRGSECSRRHSCWRKCMPTTVLLTVALLLARSIPHVAGDSGAPEASPSPAGINQTIDEAAAALAQAVENRPPTASLAGISPPVQDLPVPEAAAAPESPAPSVASEPKQTAVDHRMLPSSSESEEAAASPAPESPAAESPAPVAVIPETASVPGAAATTLSVAEGTVAQVAAAGVPDRCIIAGSSLFSACATEIATAQRRFNISVDVLAPQNYTAILQAQGVSRQEAVEAMRQILEKPSTGCCTAHCKFNQQLLCDCEPSVLDVAVRFAGADVRFYGLLVEQLAMGCGQKLFLNESCPPNRTEALMVSKAQSLGLLNASEEQKGYVMDGFCVLVNGSTAADGSTAVPATAAEAAPAPEGEGG